NLAERQIEDLHLRNVGLFEALRTLASYRGVPIGIELRPNGNSDVESNPRLNLDVVHNRLEDVLKLIFDQVGEYDWKIEDGAVNVFPRHSRDPLIEKLLNTQIHYFTHRKGASRVELKSAIIESPEVANLLQQNNTVGLSLSITLEREQLPPSVDLSITNASVK